MVSVRRKGRTVYVEHPRAQLKVHCSAAPAARALVARAEEQRTWLEAAPEGEALARRLERLGERVDAAYYQATRRLRGGRLRGSAPGR